MSASGTKQTYRDDLLLVRFRCEADTRDWSRVADFVANDPKRTLRGLKSRSAAAYWRVVCAIVWTAAQEGSAAPHVDSERFRPSPRTCRPFCGRLSMR